MDDGMYFILFYYRECQWEVAMKVALPLLQVE